MVAEFAVPTSRNPSRSELFPPSETVPLCQPFALPGPLKLQLAETKPSLERMVPDDTVVLVMLFQPEMGATPAVPVTKSVVLPRNLMPNDSASVDAMRPRLIKIAAILRVPVRFLKD